MYFSLYRTNTLAVHLYRLVYRICRNKRPERLIFRSNNKKFQNPSVSCTPPFEKSPINSHRFCVLPPLKNHPSTAIGFVYSPLWKITHQQPSVLCTPPFEKSPIKSHRFRVLPPLKNYPIKSHRFRVLPPLKNHWFWWALFLGGALISANMACYHITNTWHKHFAVECTHKIDIFSYTNIDLK